MPMGAFRLNSLSKLISQIIVAGDQVLTSYNDTLYNGVRNTCISYMGNDSNSNPTFVFGWADTSGVAKLLTLKLNSDLSITIGTVYTLATGVVWINVCTERDGSGFRATSGFTDYGYTHWFDGTNHNIASFSYNVNSLTLTLGSVVTATNQAGANSTGTYIGNQQYAFNQGPGGWNDRQKIWQIVTRTSGTTTLTLTANSQYLQTANSGGNYEARGLAAGCLATIEGSGWNGGGWDVFAIRNNAGTWVEDSKSNIDEGVSKWSDYPSNSENHMAQLNTTDRFLSTCCANFSLTTGQSIKTAAHKITWGTGATLPILTTGQVVLVSTNGNYRYNICGSWDENDAFMLFQDNLDSNKLKYKLISVDSATGLRLSQNPFITLADVSPAELYDIQATRITKVDNTAYLISVLRKSDGSFDFLTGKFNLTTYKKYSVFTSSPTISEGSSVTFTINTLNVANGTTLYYDIESISGTINSTDFSDGQTTGSFIINSNTGSFSKTLVSNDSSESPESFKVNIRTDSTSGEIVASTEQITVNEIITLSYVANATGTTSVVIPASAAIGDIAVLWDFSATNTQVNPSGWTPIVSSGTTSTRITASYKVLVSGDPGSTITGQSGTTRKTVLIFRRSSAIGNITLSTPNSQATSAAPSSQTITGGTGAVIYFACHTSTSTAPTRGWSPGTPTEFINTYIYARHLIYNNVTPPTTTITTTDGGTNSLTSFWLAVNP